MSEKKYASSLPENFPENGLGKLQLNELFSPVNLLGNAAEVVGESTWNHRGTIAGVAATALLVLVRDSVNAQDGGPGSDGEAIGILDQLGLWLSSISEYSVQNPLRFFAGATTTGAMWGGAQFGGWLIMHGGDKTIQLGSIAKDKLMSKIRKNGGEGDENKISSEAVGFIKTGLTLAQRIGLISDESSPETLAGFQQFLYVLHQATGENSGQKSTSSSFKEEVAQHLWIIPKEMMQWLTASVLFGLGMRNSSPELTNLVVSSASETALARWFELCVMAGYIVQALLPEGVHLRLELGDKKH